ncbi:MAG: hypothetical protein J7495_06220 [Sphingomonas sp.]|nr:hypothetical protein [Sphingomonas sp.]
MQQKFVGDVTRILFFVIFLCFVVYFVWLRFAPLVLRRRWVCICQRHHVQFFQEFMFSSVIGNHVLQRAPRFEIVSYRRGSLPDYIARERSELTRRFRDTAGYVVTFDREALIPLAHSGVQIGGETYKLSEMQALGLDENYKMEGLEPDKRAAIDFTAERVAHYARPLFWGLAGVVLKQVTPASSVGGFAVQDSAGRPSIDLAALVAAVNSDTPPSCKIYVLNWPVLLWNLLAITITGKAELFQDEEIKQVTALLDGLRLAGKHANVIVVDNPFVLMDAIEEEVETIVIGGGSWLLDTAKPEIKLLPILAPQGAMLSKYMECLGYLMLPAPYSTEVRKDARTIDTWVRRQFERELLIGSPTFDATRVSLPCWVPLNQKGNVLLGLDLAGIEVIDRVIPLKAPHPLSIFEIE